MKKNIFGLALFSFLVASRTLFPFPQTERPVIGPGKPLSLPGVNAQASQMTVTADNRYLVLAFGSNVKVVDLASFSLLKAQVNSFSVNVAGIAALPDGRLYILTSDAKIYRTSTSAPEAAPTAFDLSGQLGSNPSPSALIVGKETTNPLLYFLEKNQKKLYIFDTSTNQIQSSVDLGGANLTGIVFARFPSPFNPGRSTGRIFVSTDTGVVWSIEEDTRAANQLALTPAGKNISGISLDPTQDRLYVLNQTDNEIYVLSTSTPDPNNKKTLQLDRKDPANPNSAFVNTNLRNILAISTQNPARTHVYISGDQGVSVFRPTLSSDPQNDTFEFLDLDGTNDNIRGPLAVSAVPGPLVATSAEDGYLFSSTSSGALLVLSENPALAINEIAPAGPYTNANPTFSLKFSTDETCPGAKYRVRVNGDLKESGALLTSEVVLAGMETQPLQTATININSASDPNLFIEGENRIFVFLEDCDGSKGTGFRNSVGRNSVLIQVDRPPPDVKIQGVGFGNKKGIVNIQRIDQADISGYNVFVLKAVDQSNPTCPGGLDFTSTPVTLKSPQPASGDTVSIAIPDLANNTFYCVAIQAVDNAGQTSPTRVIVTTPVRPEETLGIAGAFGEKGCALGAESTVSWLGIILFLLPFSLLGYFRFKRSFSSRPFLLILVGTLFLSSFFSHPVESAELTPKKYSFELQGGFFLPQNDTLKKYLGCCNGTYNLRFGRLWDSKYELNLGVGFMIQNKNALGANSGAVSGEKFNFLVLPISNSFVFRGQFLENQVLVPFVSAGLDYMFFRENLQGDVTKGWKFGYHASGGLMILLEWFDKMNTALEEDFGINDTFLTLEAKWSQIDNFGGNGLKFNGLTFSAGLLFEF